LDLFISFSISYRSQPKPTLSSFLQTLLDSNNSDGSQQNTVVVQRRRVLRSVCRAISDKSFSFKKPVSIVFSGEEADDFGGPRREFFKYG